jgi:phosphoribosylformylglycinamidine (FGAM) synthase PurS component
VALSVPVLSGLIQQSHRLRCLVLQAVMKELNNENMAEVDKLRLVMLYALRFEKENVQQMEALISKVEAQCRKYKPGVMTPYSVTIYIT